MNRGETRTGRRVEHGEGRLYRRRWDSADDFFFFPLFRSNFLVTPRGYLARHEDLTGRVARGVVAGDDTWGKLQWGRNVGRVRG